MFVKIHELVTNLCKVNVILQSTINQMPTIGIWTLTMHNAYKYQDQYFTQVVWEHYSQSSTEAGFRAAAYTTFLSYWRELAPRILVMKPMTDLCWICQKNSSAITKTRNMPDETKSLVSSNTI